MSVADELSKLASLKERGLLTDEEFQKEKEKEKLLAGASSAALASSAATRAEPEPEPEKKGGGGLLKVFLWLGGAVAAFLIFGATVGNTPEAKARMASKDAISLCWKEQERKSLTPGAQRFVAGTCEKMEADYRAKWGRNP